MMQPLVSVSVVTYNHEKYIAQCIEGILMQKTDFPFEIIIGEDCSLDRTREIVLEYKEKYPDKIKLVLSEQNTGGMPLVIKAQRESSGKYFASCEGDDYWIDPLKLQKQADFMEAHPDISMCFHNVIILNEKKTFARLRSTTPHPETMDFEEACAISMSTASVMTRSSVVATLPVWREKIHFGDILLRLWSAHQGKIGYLDEVMSVYRRHAGGITTIMKSNLEARQAEILSIYRRFDSETDYVHTSAIQAQISKVENLHKRERMGWLYFLLYPHHAISRLKKYVNIISSENQMW
jgi:glycosyltransferase involved in cell wall biosynthesis